MSEDKKKRDHRVETVGNPLMTVYASDENEPADSLVEPSFQIDDRPFGLRELRVIACVLTVPFLVLLLVAALSFLYLSWCGVPGFEFGQFAWAILGIYLFFGLPLGTVIFGIGWYVDRQGRKPR